MDQNVLKSLQRRHLIRSAYMSLLPDHALDLVTETIVVEPVSHESPDVLSAEFRKLRAVRGHYSGGMWNHAVDGWNGRKHAVMNELASYALDHGVRFQRLVQLMGEPDDLFQSDDPRAVNFSSTIDFPNPDFFAVYFWRAQHDYLAFTVDHNQVAHVDWVYTEYEQGAV